MKKDKVAIGLSSQNWSFCKCYGDKMFHIGRTYTDVGGLGKGKGRKWERQRNRRYGVCCTHWLVLWCRAELAGKSKKPFLSANGSPRREPHCSKEDGKKRRQSWEMLGGGRERWVKGRRGATEDPGFLAWVPEQTECNLPRWGRQRGCGRTRTRGRRVRYRLGHPIQGRAKNSVIKTNNVPVQYFLIKMNTPPQNPWLTRSLLLIFSLPLASMWLGNITDLSIFKTLVFCSLWIFFFFAFTPFFKILH